MSLTMKLSPLTHDLVIRDGKITTISGDSEILQRLKISILHFKGEYFLNKRSGVDYPNLLGTKKEVLLRTQIMAEAQKCPGIVSVKDIQLNRTGRSYYMDLTVLIRSSNGDYSEQKITGVEIDV